MAEQPSDKAHRQTPTTKKAAPRKGAAKSRAGAKDATDKGLTPKQRDFVAQYLIDMNGTQAYLRVSPGVTEKSAGVAATRLLADARIQDAIATARADSAKRLELTRDDVIAQYRRIGFSDPRKFFDAHGQLKPIHELDDDTAAALQGFDVEMRMLDGVDEPPVPVVKVKWADRKTALDSIMKAQGWNSAEKHEVTGKGGKPIEHAVRVVLVPPKQKAEVTVKPLKRNAEAE